MNASEIYALTDIAIVKRIGAKIKEARIEQNITQIELAKSAGVSAFSVSSIENGNNTSLLTLVQILRALERFDLLDTFFQEKPISPIAYAKLMEERHVYKRASKRKNINKTEEEW